MRDGGGATAIRAWLNGVALGGCGSAASCAQPLVLPLKQDQADDTTVLVLAVNTTAPGRLRRVFVVMKSDDTPPESSEAEHTVRVSYLEIYNEEIRDLMSKKPQKLELKDKDTGVYVKDLSTFVVKSPADMTKVFDEGTMNRHVAATAMNEHSSRSHSVFTIIVESSVLDNEGEAHVKVGKLNMVDLAGSER